MSEQAPQLHEAEQIAANVQKNSVLREQLIVDNTPGDYDEFDGAYSKVFQADTNGVVKTNENGEPLKSNRHTYLIDKEGNSRSIRRAEAIAKAEARISQPESKKDEVEVEDFEVDLTEAKKLLARLNAGEDLPEAYKNQLKYIADQLQTVKSADGKSTNYFIKNVDNNGYEYSQAIARKLAESLKEFAAKDGPLTSHGLLLPKDEDRIDDAIAPPTPGETTNAPADPEDTFLKDYEIVIGVFAKQWAKAAAEGNAAKKHEAEDILMGTITEAKQRGIVNNENQNKYFAVIRQAISKAEAEYTAKEPLAAPVDSTPAPQPTPATPRTSGRLSTRDLMNLYGSDFDKRPENRERAQAEFYALIDNIVAAERSGDTATADGYDTQLRELILADPEYQRLSRAEKQAFMDRIATDITDKLLTDEPVDEPIPESVRVNKINVAIGRAFARITSRERREQGMSRKMKVGLGIGAAAVAAGGIYAAYRYGIHTDVAHSTPKSGTTGGDNDAIIDMLSGRGSAKQGEVSQEVVEMLNGKSVKQTEIPQDVVDMMAGRAKAPSAEAFQQLNESIANRTSEIMQTPGTHIWDRAHELYGDQATPKLIRAVDRLKSQGVNIGWSEDPYTSTQAAIELNGSQSAEATAQAWQQISEALARDDVEQFLQNASNG